MSDDFWERQQQHREAMAEASRQARHEARVLDAIAKATGTPVVALKRPRCPSCGALNRTPTKTITTSENVTQKRTCETCGTSFITILE